MLLALSDHKLTESGIYSTRVTILQQNVKQWHPSVQNRSVEIKVGIGFSATLPLTVNSFEPVNQDLLQHVNFRNPSSAFLKMAHTEPFALYEYEVKHQSLDLFLDQTLPDLLKEQPTSATSNVWRRTFEVAYRLSKDGNRKDVGALSDVLDSIMNLFSSRHLCFNDCFGFGRLSASISVASGE